MNEKVLGRLYQDISETVVETIQEEWSKVYLYGEIVEGSQTSYFYYYPDDSNEPVYCHDIPELFQVNEEQYKKLWHQLLDYLQQLYKEFKNNDQEPWTNLTMLFNSSGKFKIDYNYDDMTNADSHERKVIWKYNYLGISPKSNSGRRKLENI
ncbi:antitoxin YezG family protein [Scopulibacillus cellulosilyticus]|uniref:Antitoxin YezG family protein n=1 Tax=Scopulibacillus cellulosilyticus TaxID=2665665 RepID=A0ABW2PVT8_9BACL